jgi:hypothetical protein
MPQTLQKSLGGKFPWPKALRIPKIYFPSFKGKQMALPTPTGTIIMIGLYVLLFWLMLGGMYIQIRDPIALGADSAGNPVWLYPSTSDAFILESIVAASIIYVGSFGFIVMFSATKNRYNYTFAIELLVIGLLMTAVSFGLLQWIIGVKQGTIAG